MTPQTPKSHELIFSVSQITAAIKSHLEPAFNHITVKGEISNLKIQASGHVYFSLIDRSSLLNAVIFKSHVTPLVKNFKDGDEVIATGEISVYQPRGNYQLVIRSIRPNGTGLELIKLQELKKKLHNLGWFQPERKKPIPTEWKKIGIITSPTGAVIHDILSVLERRMGNRFHLILYPVRVQGDLAPLEIAQAITSMNRHKLVDLLIVCRGGGSSDDLSPFNSEIVAQACFDSSIPIISAVGHETDTTILDLVADIRAPTPSAAAEIVSQTLHDILKKGVTYQDRSIQKITQVLEEYKNNLKKVRKALYQTYHPYRLQELYSQQLDDCREDIYKTVEQILFHMKTTLNQAKNICTIRHPSVQLLAYKKQCEEYKNRIMEKAITALEEKKQTLPEFESSIHSTLRRVLDTKRELLIRQRPEERKKNALTRLFFILQEKLRLIQENHTLLNPKLPLLKGYALIVQDIQSDIAENRRRVIHSIKHIHSGDTISILLKDGKAEASIKSITMESPL